MSDKGAIKNRLRGLLGPAVNLLARLGISPLAITIAGLVVSFAGAVLIARGSLFWGGIILIVSGLCDTMDGSLARLAGKETRFGAFIDSTIDRVAEIAYFGALIVYYAAQGESGRLAVILSIVASAGSFLTSYTRARAEGLGLDCRVGLLERPERVAILVLGLLIGKTALFVAIACLAALTVATSFQRIVHVYRLTAKKDVSG